MRQGCPQVTKKVALQLIEELEKEERVKKMEVSEEQKWLEDLVEVNPVLMQETPQEGEGHVGGSPKRKSERASRVQSEKTKEDVSRRFFSPSLRRSQ